MASNGPWGCYIHIPKTSGSWVKRVLAELGPGKRDGDVHQLPRIWAYPRYFTTVREPADYLVSVFCQLRGTKWQDFNYDCPWRDFVRLLIPHRTKDFEEFIDRVTTKEAGIVSWLYGCYTPPKVQAIRYGKDMTQFLEELECHPERMMPVNVSGNKPEMTAYMRSKVWIAEYQAYSKYGFTIDGSYRY